MAAFKRKAETATTDGQVVYTTPAAKTGLAIGMILANRSDNPATASIDINGKYIIRNAPSPVGSTLGVLDGKLAIEQNEIVTVSASANNSIDCTLTVLEL
jgi:hypothetical protein